MSGTVDRVTVHFLDPVLPTPAVTVTGPDGEAVAGLEDAELVDDDTVEVRFDPLVAGGRYRVSYDYASLDGFPQSDAHEFSFDPEGEGSRLELRAALAVVLGLLVLGFVAVAVRERRRSP